LAKQTAYRCVYQRSYSNASKFRALTVAVMFVISQTPLNITACMRNKEVPPQQQDQYAYLLHSEVSAPVHWSDNNLTEACRRQWYVSQFIQTMQSSLAIIAAIRKVRRSIWYQAAHRSTVRYSDAQKIRIRLGTFP